LGVAILGLGKIKYNFFSASILVIISSFLSYFFIQWRGLTGAAIAQPIVYFIVLVVVIFMTKYAIKNHKFTIETERNKVDQ